MDYHNTALYPLTICSRLLNGSTTRPMREMAKLTALRSTAAPWKNL